MIFLRKGYIVVLIEFFSGIYSIMVYSKRVTPDRTGKINFYIGYKGHEV